MRKIKFFEEMRGHLNDVSAAELNAFKGYKLSHELNLDYPLIVDMYGDAIVSCAMLYSKLGIAKFYFAYPSTATSDYLALLYNHCYSIIGVIPTKVLLGEESWHTACKYILVIGKRRGPKSV